VIATVWSVDPRVLLAEIDVLEGRGVDTAAEGERQTPTDLPYQPGAGQGHRSAGSARTRSANNASGHRPGGPTPTRRQGVGARGCRTCSTPRSSAEARHRLKEEERGPQPRVQPAARSRRRHRGGVPRRLRAAPRADDQRHRQPAARRAHLGQNVLLEGAQATFLDLDHGTYPFVTSSKPGWPVGRAPDRHRAALHRPGHRDSPRPTSTGSGPARSHRAHRTETRAICSSTAGASTAPNTGRRRRVGFGFDAVMMRHAVRSTRCPRWRSPSSTCSTRSTPSRWLAYELDGERFEHLPYTSRCCTRPRRSTPSCPVERRSHRRHRAAHLPPAALEYVAFSRAAGRRSDPPLVGVAPAARQFLHFAA